MHERLSFLPVIVAATACLAAACGLFVWHIEKRSDERQAADIAVPGSPAPQADEGAGPEAMPVRLLFVGDVMLDRTIRKDGEAQGYAELFSCLREPFSAFDEVIGNLEGSVTDLASVSRDAPYDAPESFRFTFDPAAVRALRDAGLSVASIANNHIRDYGEEGIRQTLTHAQDIGLAVFGDPRKGGTGYVVRDAQGTRIAYVAYNEFFGSAERTLDDLRAASAQSDVQVVYAHWGDEYVPVRGDVRQLAHALADAGADLIVGAHPHVVQESETYAGVPIYYSLGNFIFDQYWNPEVSTGLALEVTVEDQRIASIREKAARSKRHAGTCFDPVQ